MLKSIKSADLEKVNGGTAEFEFEIDYDYENLYADANNYDNSNFGLEDEEI